MDSIYFTDLIEVRGTLKIFDLLFAAVPKEIPDEPKFTMEMVYETPRDLYMTTTETGGVCMVNYFPSFTHQFSAPELMPS